MPMDPPAHAPTLQLRLRVYCGREPALGPGRAELMARVDGTASIAQAARDMDMSYMKAWKLVQSMNRCFREPLIEVQRGGKSGGAARLTPLGREALELYRCMEAASVAATQPFEAQMARLFRPAAV